MRDGKLFPYIFVFFTGIFGVRKVQCYLSVQVTVLLEIWILFAMSTYSFDKPKFTSDRGGGGGEIGKQ